MFLIRWIALNLGRPFARLFLYPIAFYFLVFSIKARRASRKYLTRIFNREPTLLEQWRHFHTFSSTILDRVYLLTGQEHLLDIQIHNADIPLEKMKSGQGCILLGSHLGSFEVLRILAVHEKDLPLKILMYSDHNETITRMLNALDPEIIKTVIPLGKVDTLLKVKESLDQGYSIGMLGDRIAESDKQVECKILGETVPFPAGPMLLSVALNVPIVLFYGLYKGGRRYDVHFELLTEAPNVSRKQRGAVVDTLTCRYAQRLEYYAHQAPYNWFNFYDYWDTP
ncbi:MAG: lipid A biosynthesis acyltransferase [Gammaproteobacteria bacterium]|nr:lipid A biosynthesis acyltransferase [Gammaproteobacteria bacterium]